VPEWKVLYRDVLDRDRTSRDIPSKDAALKQARDLSHPLIFSRAKMQLEVGILMRRVSYDES